MTTENTSSLRRWRVGSPIRDVAGRTSSEPATGGAGTVMSVDGVDLHVRVDGPVQGRALLMLHGFGASTAWFDQLVARLPEYRIIRIDLLGHGGSARPASGYDPDNQGRLYARLLSELDLNGVTVVGHSMGSIFGVATAEHSTRVTRLVLMGEGPDTSTGTLPPGEWVIHTQWIGPILQQHGPVFVTRSVVRRAFAAGFDMATAFTNPSQGLDDARSLNHPAFTQSMKQRQVWTRRLGLDARLANLALPALVIFGREDRFYNVDASLARYRAVRTITTTVLEHVGHSPMIEAPDRVADLIRTFLSTGETLPGIQPETADSERRSDDLRP
ncbi:MAG: alpha/beta hydrolase [Nocardiaceae bacterium]|nr:alpha/beta hydrolase [Nocardiaceae bacterium]